MAEKIDGPEDPPWDVEWGEDFALEKLVIYNVSDERFEFKAPICSKNMRYTLASFPRSLVHGEGIEPPTYWV